MDLQHGHFLSEDAMSQKVLNELSLPFRPFKRLSDEEKSEALVYSVAKVTDKMMKKTGNQNIKDILNSKGDFHKTKYFKDFEKTFSYLKVVNSNGVNKIFSSNLKTIESGYKLLEKEKANFKRCFNTGNEVGQLIYITLASSVVLSTINLFYLGLNKEETSKLKINTEKLSKKGNTELETIENLVKMQQSGKLKSILKTDKKIKLEESFLDKLANADLNELVGKAENLKYVAVPVGIVIASMLAILVIKQTYIKIIKTRSKFADYLRDAVNIIDGEKENGIDEHTKEKQQKLAEKIAKLADKIDIDNDVAEVQGKSESENIDNELSRELETDFNITF